MAWFKRYVTLTLMTQVPVVAFGLGAGVLTASLLGPKGRGIYALCIMIANTAVFFAQLNLGQSVAYHIGRRGIPPARVLGASLGLVILLVDGKDLARIWQAGLDAVSLRALHPGGGDPR